MQQHQRSRPKKGKSGTGWRSDKNREDMKPRAAGQSTSDYCCEIVGMSSRTGQLGSQAASVEGVGVRSIMAVLLHGGLKTRQTACHRRRRYCVDRAACCQHVSKKKTSLSTTWADFPGQKAWCTGTTRTACHDHWLWLCWPALSPHFSK